MALSLTAFQKSICNLFEASERYTIPDFQRAYSWEYNPCFQLYTDLTRAYVEGEEYFLGNILLARSLRDSKTPYVIDGQQRLLTLWIMIKVLSLLLPDYSMLPKLLRVNLSLRDESYMSKVVSEVPEVNDQTQIETLYGLCNEADVESLNCHDERDGLILANFMLYYNWFSEYRMRDRNDLEAFCDYLLERVYVLPIEISGDDRTDATNRTLTIFETLNNRGEELGDADIFKSRLYAKAKHDGKEREFMNQWVELKECCTRMKVKIDDVFRYYTHVLRGKAGVTTAEINMRDFYVNTTNAPLVVMRYEDVMKDLFDIVRILEYLDESGHRNNLVTIWLQILDAYTNVYPFYAVIVYLFVNGISDDVKFVDFLKNLVRQCYGYGSSSSIKFSMYNTIKLIANKGVYQCTYPDMNEEKFNYLGRLRNGLVLLSYYLQDDTKVLLSYRVRPMMARDMFFETQEGWWNADWDKIENSLYNFVIIGKFTCRENVDKNDNIVKDGSVMSKSLPAGYPEFCDKERIEMQRLLNFFRGE